MGKLNIPSKREWKQTPIKEQANDEIQIRIKRIPEKG